MTELRCRCRVCLLRWVIFTGRRFPDRRCPFCGSTNTAARKAPQGDGERWAA